MPLEIKKSKVSDTLRTFWLLLAAIALQELCVNGIGADATVRWEGLMASAVALVALPFLYPGRKSTRQ